MGLGGISELEEFVDKHDMDYLYDYILVQSHINDLMNWEMKQIGRC